LCPIGGYSSGATGCRVLTVMICSIYWRSRYRMESSMTNATPLSDAGTITSCQLCGSMRQTAAVKFERNVGMLVLRQTRRLQARMCKTCLDKQFWNFQGMNLLL